MEKTKTKKISSNKYDSVAKYAEEKGWYVPSLHEKYIKLIEKDKKMIKESMEKLENLEKKYHK